MVRDIGEDSRDVGGDSRDVGREGKKYRCGQ